VLVWQNFKTFLVPSKFHEYFLCIVTLYVVADQRPQTFFYLSLLGWRSCVAWTTTNNEITTNGPNVNKLNSPLNKSPIRNYGPGRPWRLLLAKKPSPLSLAVQSQPSQCCCGLPSSVFGSSFSDALHFLGQSRTRWQSPSLIWRFGEKGVSPWS